MSEPQGHMEVGLTRESWLKVVPGDQMKAIIGCGYDESRNIYPDNCAIFATIRMEDAKSVHMQRKIFRQVLL